jgi:4-amino-4-deoxy-L-arabinose transferase-like glycosyltransferase
LALTTNFEMIAAWRTKGFWAVAALAFLLRLGAFLAVDRPEGLFHSPDSEEYDQLAWNLASRGSYSLANHDPHTPDLTRTPVYPCYLASCYLLLGHWPAAAVAFQLVLGTGTCVLAVVMAGRLFGPKAGLVSGGLLALDPLSIHYCALLLSETLFTLIFTLSLYCLLGYARQPRLGSALATAGLSALAVLCRPIAVFWPLVPLLLFAIYAWRQHQWRPLVHAGLFAVVVGVAVSAWVIRNQRVGGLPVLSTVQGQNLYYHRAAPIVAHEESITINEARRRLEKRLRENTDNRAADQPNEYRRMERAGRDIIVASPGTYLRLHGLGLARMFAPRKKPPPWPLTVNLLRWVEAGYLSVVYGLALVGLLACLRGGPRLGLVFGGVVLYFAVLSGPEAYARFRVPVMPSLVLLAGVGATADPRSLIGSRLPAGRTQEVESRQPQAVVKAALQDSAYP